MSCCILTETGIFIVHFVTANRAYWVKTGGEQIKKLPYLFYFFALSPYLITFARLNGINKEERDYEK